VAPWLMFLGKLLVLGPLIGFAIGGAGAWLMGNPMSTWACARNIKRSTAWD